jgi:hypothetical protein
MHHLGTGDHKTPTGLRRLPLGLVAMLVTVVAIEKYEVRRGCALSGCLASARETTAKELKREYASVARGQAREPEILCFGDSLIKLGVFPKVIERVSGRPAYNLAIASGPIGR